MDLGEMADLMRVDTLGRCFDGVRFLSGDRRRRAISRRVQVCPYLGTYLLTMSQGLKWYCDPGKVHFVSTS